MRFCFKAFSYLQELENLSSDFSHLAWIDADVVCKTPFGATDFRSLLPAADEIASYLGRTAFPPLAPHSECGFVGFSLKNRNSIEFLQSFIAEYTTGHLFTHKEWHDSFIFDQVRLHYETRGHVFRNIFGPHHTEEHPFVLSPLGQFFDHLKGPARKAKGHS